MNASTTANTLAPLSIDVILAQELQRLEREGLRRTIRTVRDRRGAEREVDGQWVIDFASSDYLGLAGEPRIGQALARAAEAAGTGAGSARLVAGHHPLHAELEREIARCKRTQSALLFPSGYMANTGAIPALVGRDDVIYADALNHASLVDGCRLSRAVVRIVPHGDVDALRALLAHDRDAGTYRRRLIVVDSVFSMDGDLYPLDALVPLARAHDAWTYVDDAHGTGVLGARGHGAPEHFAVAGSIDVTMTTLGKALGTSGACVAGSRTVVDLLTQRARTFVFTTGSPPALAAATLEALRVAEYEPWRRDRVRANGARLRAALVAYGIIAPAPGAPHIIPVILGDAGRTMRAGDALRARGFLVGAIRPPSVAPGSARLRITVSAAHTPDQIDALADALDRVLADDA